MCVVLLGMLGWTLCSDLTRRSNSHWHDKNRIYIRVQSDGKFILRQISLHVEGRKKGQVGRVVNMGILDTQQSFTGTVGIPEYDL